MHSGTSWIRGSRRRVRKCTYVLVRVSSHTPGIAHKLLNTSEGDLDIVTLKIPIVCRAEILEAPASGKTGPMFFSICTSIRQHLHTTVEPSESYNSLLKMISQRCRNITIGLLMCVLYH